MSAQVAQPRSKAAGLVDALVDSGIVAPEDRTRAIAILGGRLAESGDAAPRSKILAEIAGYAGAILVLAAGAVFLAASWREMTLATRVGALAVGALILAGAAVGARVTGRPGSDPGEVAVRRRLAGVFGVGCAALVTGALGTYLESRHSGGEWLALVFGVFTAVSLAFYLLAPTVPGQAALGFGAVLTVVNATSRSDIGETLVTTAILLTIGVGWLVLAEAGWWREPDTARMIGGAIALIGAETPVFYGRMPWLAYLLLALLGALAFAAYLRLRAWPYLAIGVVGLTLAATQAAVDYLPSATGAASGLLVAGAMLLGTSMFAMRLRKAADLERTATTSGEGRNAEAN